MQSELLIIRLKCGKAKQRLKNGTGWTSSLSPCSRHDSSAPDDCAIGPVALGSACGRGAAYRPSPPQPRQPLGGELHSGCKRLSGGYISAMKYGCEPRVCACPSVRVHLHKVNWRSTLTLPPETWRQSRAGKAAAAVSLTHSPSYVLLSVLLFFVTLFFLPVLLQFACR